MPCSAITLSLATITAIVSVAMLAIAFSTDNWLYYEVRRSSILVSVNDAMIVYLNLCYFLVYVKFRRRTGFRPQKFILARTFAIFPYSCVRFFRARSVHAVKRS